jgi:hypothetical protein
VSAMYTLVTVRPPAAGRAALRCPAVALGTRPGQGALHLLLDPFFGIGCPLDRLALLADSGAVRWVRRADRAPRWAQRLLMTQGGDPRLLNQPVLLSGGA